MNEKIQRFYHLTLDLIYPSLSEQLMLFNHLNIKALSPISIGTTIKLVEDCAEIGLINSQF